MNERTAFDYLKKLNDDLIQQFKDKPNTQVLMKALSKQLQAVFDFYYQLLFERHLDIAVGNQLDGIGDIVCLTRYEASLLSDYYNKSSDMDDETYRKYLKYKILLNTNTCTYPDIMKALKVFWDTSPIIYSETPQRPATIIIETPPLKPEAKAGAFLQIPTVKAAGVTLIMKANTIFDEENEILSVGGVFISCTEVYLPEKFVVPDMKNTLYVGGAYAIIYESVLPSYSSRYAALIDADGSMVLDASGKEIHVKY